VHAYYVFFLLALLGALLVSAVGTPIVKQVALRWGAIDQPAQRKIHTSPIPRLGGLAMWVALWAAALAGARLMPADYILTPSSSLPELGAIFAAATVILAIGMSDDSRGGMRPFTKLVFQFVACVILVAFGVHVNIFGTYWLDLPLTFLWVVGLTNALNLLDNMDGLSAGAAAIASAFFFLLAVLNGQILVALLAAALAGSCLGFLIYNYNPASIFMGDTGSLTLGFMLAVLGMKLQVHNASRLSFVVAVLVLGVPIFDTAFVVWRRLREGREVMQGGKDHTSHRLVNLGLNQKQAVWALYVASFAAGIAAVVASQGNHWFVISVMVPVTVAVLTAAWFLSKVHTGAQQS
jgi:UDP-GlcNAc:undecaprenyl-phosphate GlcNAc-1-phosphate transferase